LVPPPPARLLIEKEPLKFSVIWPEKSTEALESLEALRLKNAAGKLPGKGRELSIPVMVTGMSTADSVVPPKSPVLPLFVAVNRFGGTVPV